MKALRFVLASWGIGLLVVVSASEAQPWEWQLYEGDYYNPTGFPQPLQFSEYPTETIGDFNGDGRDEFFNLLEPGFVIAERDSADFRWAVTQGQQDLSVEWATGTWAMNLDTALGEELIVYGTSVHAWKAVSSDPWIWEQQDDLLTDLYFPSNTLKAVFGDYDSDGLLNGVCWLAGIWGGEVHLYERSPDSAWSLDSALVTNGGVIAGLYDGDFDHDGDTDFAVAPYLTDVPAYGTFGENTPQGLVIRPAYWAYYDFPGPTGGDLDGDGEWEGLYRYEGYSGYHLVEVEDQPGNFIRVVSKQYIGRIPGPLIGNFRTCLGTMVGATRSWAYGPPFYVMDAFALMIHSESGWNDLDNGFYDDMGYRCTCGNMADLDGDNLEDIFTILVNYDWGSEWWAWALWKNIGSDSADHYDHWSARFFLPNLAGPDTVFYSPQIGDISGDRRAELAVVAEPTAGERQVLFYEMIGEIADTTFELRSEWSCGLPTGFEKIRLADIDNNGLSEVIGLDSGVWYAYFYRHGRWELYENILPIFSANDISFADMDNDGDLDLFTPTEVWISLSPSAADEPFIAHPASFSLLAFPNPFNPSTQIAYELTKAGHVSLVVYDVLGREVATLVDEVQLIGRHSITFDGSDLASGVYLYRLQAGDFVAAKKMVLLR